MGTYIHVENSGARFNKDGKTFQPRFSVFSPWGPYDILYTDYENLAVVHSCQSYGLFKAEYAWILARKPYNENDAEYAPLVAKARSVLEEQIPGFDFDGFLRPTI